MRHFPFRFTFCALACFLSWSPTHLFALSGSKAPEDERGWASVWKEPATEQQRKQQELVRKLGAAQAAGNFSAALVVCDQLIALSPQSPGPYMIRAVEHIQLKQYDHALADLDQAQERARRQQSPSAGANIMSMRAAVHERQKDYAAAVNDLQTAIRLNPKNETAYNGLAWLRATSPDATYRNGPESVRLAQKAVGLATNNKCADLDTLAAAYAEANDYGRAVDFEERAMTAIKSDIKDTAKAQKFQNEAAARLRLYQQHQAYHADLP